MIKKISLLYILFEIILFHAPTSATEELTLVVGNTRTKGWVKPSVSNLVGQDEANFTHETSFTGRVVSVDMESLGVPQNYEHLGLNIITTDPNKTIQALGGTQPNRIFFEWFPSCVHDKPKGNIRSLLLPALRNAFEVLAKDGELIVEHFPYVVCLPDQSSDALKMLMATINCDLSYLRSAAPHSSLTQVPGVVSQLLQKADPFTIHVTSGVHEEMRAYLAKKAKDQSHVTSPSERIDCFIIDAGISLFSQNFGVNKATMAGILQNGLVGSYTNKHEEYQGYFDLFEQYYFMETQGSAISGSLSKIGFQDITIDYNPEPNPYNGRKHSWIIKGYKPVLLKLTKSF